MIKINAIDTLFFRNGRPFDLGDESWAEGIFPPLPSTFKGMLAGAYMSHFDLKPSEAYEKAKEFSINGVYLQVGGEIYFPTPADLVAFKDFKRYQALFLEIKPSPRFSNSILPYTLQASANGKIEEVFGTTLVDQSGFQDYLRNDNKYIEFFNKSDFFHTEPKVGIGRDYSRRVTKDGQLYRLEMIRPIVSGIKGLNGKAINLIVDANLPSDFPEKGIIRFGAEGKVVTFEQENIEDHIPVPTINSEILKLYLATPAIFENGWYPDFLNPASDFKSMIKVDSNLKVEVEFIACALGKSIKIGGFDAQLGIPKPMYKAVPAGSVYYLKFGTVQEAQEVANFLHKRNIAEMDKAKDGFGLCFVCNYNEKKV